MHKQHLAFPLGAWLLLAPCTVGRPAAGLRADFHHPSCYQTRQSEFLRSFKGLHGRAGSNCSTTGGRSRCSPSPLEAFLTNTLCGRCRLPTYRGQAFISQAGSEIWIRTMEKCSMSRKICSSPSFLFDVTNIMSRHGRFSHVADKCKKLIT